jgi:uncharacterized protein YcbX
MLFELPHLHSTHTMVDVTGCITHLFIYPIKSCAGMPLSRSLVTPVGLEHDRQWLIINEQGQFVTQRQIPHLAWIRPTLLANGLQLQAPEQPDLLIAYSDEHSQRRKVTIWRDQVQAIDMGDAAAQWLDNYLEVPGRQFRLVQFDSSDVRWSDPHWTGSERAAVQFADGFAVNVLSQASLQHFNERLLELGGEPVDAMRFRPNIVIDGLNPNDEDNIEQMRIRCGNQDLVLDLVKPCPRCQVPEINQVTTVREPEITAVLAQYRQLERLDGALCFGVNAVVRNAPSRPLRVSDRYEANYRFD